MENKDPQVGFVGAGKMATALASGFVSKQVVQKNSLHAYDTHAEGLAKFCSATGAKACVDNAAVCKSSDIVIFAVKPNNINEAILSCSDALAGKVAVSIAAGIPLAKLEQASAKAAKWIRVMPNSPALVGCGASAFCASASVTTEEKNFIKNLLSAVGVCVEVPEKYFDIVTGLSGSGPAFVYTFIEALADAGVMGGLQRADATLLAAQTVLGSAQMVLETGRHPASLRDDVTSPGGTTIAGLLALEAEAFPAAVHAAVHAATKRSKELAES